MVKSFLPRNLGYLKTYVINIQYFLSPALNSKVMSKKGKMQNVLFDYDFYLDSESSVYLPSSVIEKLTMEIKN